VIGRCREAPRARKELKSAGEQIEQLQRQALRVLRSSVWSDRERDRFEAECSRDLEASPVIGRKLQNERLPCEPPTPTAERDPLLDSPRFRRRAKLSEVVRADGADASHLHGLDTLVAHARPPRCPRGRPGRAYVAADGPQYATARASTDCRGPRRQINRQRIRRRTVHTKR
jgi:hypothetical protein